MRESVLHLGDLRKRDLRALEAAIRHAAEGEADDYRHAAALYRKRSIRSLRRDLSNPLPHSVTPNRLRGARRLQYHAEKCCLRGAAQGDVDGASLVVVRVNRKGEAVYSRPCVHCFTFLRRLPLSRIVYSVDATRAGEIRLR